MGFNVGDVIEFGEYFQSSQDEKEPIKWRVLETNGNKALLISEDILDCVPYNNELVPVGWKGCSLRKWLNNNFFKEAFSQAEQLKIAETLNFEKIFILSEDEVEKYCVKGAKVTEYAKSKTEYFLDQFWVRSSENHPDFCAVALDVDFKINDIEDNKATVNVSDENGVRPALWINL